MSKTGRQWSAEEVAISSDEQVAPCDVLGSDWASEEVATSSDDDVVPCDVVGCGLQSSSSSDPSYPGSEPKNKIILNIIK